MSHKCKEIVGNSPTDFYGPFDYGVDVICIVTHEAIRVTASTYSTVVAVPGKIVAPPLYQTSL